MQLSRFRTLACAAVLSISACAGSGTEDTSTTGLADSRVAVTSAVVSHDTTQDISVWAPEAEGSWPVVLAIHGMGANRSFWDVTGPELASQGVVVFAPDYRSTEPQYQEQDLVCAWRYVATIADEYGGDFEQPFTLIGHSMGATVVIIGGLDEATYGPGGTYDGCLTAAPMPDVIVPISGCHYEFEGQKVGYFEFETGLSELSNHDADIVLVGGTDDPDCESWQSHDATEDFQAAGYNAKLVEIDGADHHTVIYKEFVDGEVATLPDEPAGDEVVQTILDAIDAAGP